MFEIKPLVDTGWTRLFLVEQSLELIEPFAARWSMFESPNRCSHLLVIILIVLIKLLGCKYHTGLGSLR